MFKIWCVSKKGHGSGWLKSSGQDKEFETQAQAETELQDLQSNGFFEIGTYTIEEVK